MAGLSRERVFQQIRDELREQIAVAERAVEQAREGLVIGDERAENRGERGAIQEKSWLLSAHLARLEDLKRRLLAVEGVESVIHGTVRPGALVFLEEAGQSEPEVYLLHPELGGMEIRVGEMIVFAVSPASPLGAALMDARAGEEVDVQLPGGMRHLRVVEVC